MLNHLYREIRLGEPTVFEPRVAFSPVSTPLPLPVSRGQVVDFLDRVNMLLREFDYSSIITFVFTITSNSYPYFENPFRDTSLYDTSHSFVTDILRAVHSSRSDYMDVTGVFEGFLLELYESIGRLHDIHDLIVPRIFFVKCEEESCMSERTFYLTLLINENRFCNELKLARVKSYIRMRYV